MEGWVELHYVNADWLGIETATCQSQVKRPTAAPPRNTCSMDIVSDIIIIDFVLFGPSRIVVGLKLIVNNFAYTLLTITYGNSIINVKISVNYSN